MVVFEESFQFFILILFKLYLPRTHKNYKSFFIKKSYHGKGKELESPEGQGGGKGERWGSPYLISIE